MTATFITYGAVPRSALPGLTRLSQRLHETLGGLDRDGSSTTSARITAAQREMASTLDAVRGAGEWTGDARNSLVPIERGLMLGHDSLRTSPLRGVRLLTDVADRVDLAVGDPDTALQRGAHADPSVLSDDVRQHLTNVRRQLDAALGDGRLGNANPAPMREYASRAAAAGREARKLLGGAEPADDATMTARDLVMEVVTRVEQGSSELGGPTKQAVSHLTHASDLLALMLRR